MCQSFPSLLTDSRLPPTKLARSSGCYPGPTFAGRVKEISSQVHCPRTQRLKLPWSMSVSPTSQWSSQSLKAPWFPLFPRYHRPVSKGRPANTIRLLLCFNHHGKRLQHLVRLLLIGTVECGLGHVVFVQGHQMCSTSCFSGGNTAARGRR